MSVSSHWHHSLRHPVVRAAVLLLLIGAAVSGVRAAQSDPVAEGEALFQSKCIGCHSIGQGDMVGPDLQGVTTLRDPDWLVQWIMAPEDLINQNDPIALEITAQYPVQMPNLGLSQTDAENVLAYIAAQSGDGGAAAATPVPVELPPGDSARGKDLFTGQVRFTGGGPACMSCHTAAGIGALGGGELGPDLTNVIGLYGDAGLASFLGNPSTQTMSVVWRDQPLTPQEVSDLHAFLDQASMSERPTSNVLQLLGLAIVGAAVVFLLAQLAWRGRLGGVRRRMVQGSRR